MKNEILDDFFHDKLRNEIEEGEMVFWDGRPRFNTYSSIIAAGFILFMSSHLILETIEERRYWLGVFVIALITYAIYTLFKQLRKNKVSNH